MAVWSIFFLAILLQVNHARADVVFDFEESSDTNIISNPGLSNVVISSTRYKHGQRSLRWEWGPRDELVLDLLGRNIVGNAVDKGGIKVWIYNEEAKPSHCLTISVETILKRKSSTRDCRVGSGTHYSSFYVSLAFTGWRGIWVELKEFLNCPSSAPPPGRRCERQVTELKITAPDTQANKPIYIDILQWANKISRQSRDLVVPRIVTSRCLGCSNLNSGVSMDDALEMYDRSHFWQQTYRWSLYDIPPVTQLAEADLKEKISEIHLIEKRLQNWYADEKTSFTKLELPQGSVYPAGVTDDFYLRERWGGSRGLTKNIDNAYDDFNNLQIRKSSDNPPIITGSPLFSKVSEYGKSTSIGGDRKFGYVAHRVLHPLALEYFLMSRPLEVSNTACQWAKKYKRTDKIGNDQIKLVVGKDRAMKKVFKKAYKKNDNTETPPASCTGADQYSYSHVKHAINRVNEKRKENLLLLFEYLKDQGWTKGSAVGSIDHEMNRNGAGFTHSIFLLRKELKAANQLDSLIDTLKWYTDFSEVYQTTYEYRGTTTDRMRTILLFRLMTVLMMPEEADSVNPKPQAQEKVRDMTNWKRWYNNIMLTNKGLGGVIKPDFTGFHHHAFYASAYSPAALHQAALAQYLIEGTSFDDPKDSLDMTRKNNLKKALELLKIVSVKYSTPNSVGGRFPDYSRAIISGMIPAFAYVSVSSPKFKESSTTELGDLGTLKSSETKAFLRLYDVGNAKDCGNDNTKDDGNTRVVKKYLCTGHIESHIFYLNSLGSLQILQRLKAKADDEGLLKETSPHGHWAKNFGAISIHRREDWAVTVKGFNRFVWDTENSENENVFGLYQSHGAMLIANSEDQLKHHDVYRGWDWTKIPGTTSIGFEINGLKTAPKDDRRFNIKKLAGGVTFNGYSPYALSSTNGLFGMNFIQPTYELADRSPMNGVQLKFKKSVMFYDDFLVCVGSAIFTSGVQNMEKTYTTLFQDKIFSTTSRDSERDCICRYKRKCPCPKPGKLSSSPLKCGIGDAKTAADWGDTTSISLEDTKGNRYFVKEPRQQGLHFEPRKNQKSLPPSGENRETNGVYCTAWFDHGINVRKKKYEYTIQVKGKSSLSTTLTESDYTVLRAKSEAHVLKMTRGLKTGTKAAFGYVIFRENVDVSFDSTNDLHSANGPIKTVSAPCILMTQYLENDRLVISVSSPALNLEKDSDAPTWCPNGFPQRAAKNKFINQQHEFCAASNGVSVSVKLKSSGVSVREKYYVDGEEKTYTEGNTNDHIQLTGDTIEFRNLKNGFTTEVHLGLETKT